MDDRLKLRAIDREDLEVLSSHLQDAVVPLKDVGYFPEDRRFVLVAGRFRWEGAGDDPVPGRIYERVRCGVRFEDVERVQHRGIDRRQPGQILSLLAIRGGDGFIDLVFSAGAAIRLHVSRILCQAEDIGEPWPTQWRPAHPADRAD
jgi:hypothetical protein